MSKETILAYLNSGRGDEALVITWYCFEKGKSTSLIQKFIQALRVESLYNNRREYSLLNCCYEYALTYYIMKYNIILVYNKNGKFIKAF